jgi:hypothetical protein
MESSEDIAWRTERKLSRTEGSNLGIKKNNYALKSPVIKVCSTRW